MAFRVILNVIFIIAILFFPWWFTLFIGVLLLVGFEAYEVLVGGLVADILYSAPVPLFLEFQFMMTAIFALLFVFAYYLKKKLVLYPHA